MTAASTGTQAVEDEVRARIREEVEALEGGLRSPQGPGGHRVQHPEVPCRWMLPRSGPLSPLTSPLALSPSTECSTAPAPPLFIVMQ